MPKYSLVLFLLVFCFTACVKDTDFNQTEDLVVSPIVEANFLFFTLDSGDFQPNPITAGQLRVVDTTEIRFLDDDFSIDNIVSAEFYFKTSNTFPVSLDAQFTFLSEENEPFYEINFPISASEDGSPVNTEFTQVLSAQDIELLTLNDKVIANITVQSEDENLEGVLNLQSKTIYFLEFSNL